MLLVTMGGCLAAQSQQSEESKSRPVKVKPYGFVRNYFDFDSRKTYTVVGGEYNMIPYDEEWNQDHSSDLNAVPHAQLQALTTRIGLELEGPELFGMQSGGKIEGDFGGFGTNNTVLRLRQAYIKLSSSVDGHKVEYLLGQTWHPLSGDIMPEVLGMAAGAPFRPHSRTPQLRAIGYWGHFGFTISFLYQLQYMNNGPKSATDPTSVASIDFARNAVIPEAFVGFNYKRGAWYAQLGLDAQVITPRTHAPDPMSPGVIKKVDESVGSLSPTVYAQYVEGEWSIKFRTLLASNTSHLNQLVGYAVTGVYAMDGSWVYSPMRSSISYLNLAYGKMYRVNLFMGYMKNLGCAYPLYDFGTPAGGTPSYLIYMKGGDMFTSLNSVWRVAPSLSYNIKALNIGLEYELTGCTFGDIDVDGSIKNNSNLHQVVNHRICALVKYNF